MNALRNGCMDACMNACTHACMGKLKLMFEGGLCKDGCSLEVSPCGRLHNQASNPQSTVDTSTSNRTGAEHAHKP